MAGMSVREAIEFALPGVALVDVIDEAYWIRYLEIEGFIRPREGPGIVEFTEEGRRQVELARRGKGLAE